MFDFVGFFFFLICWIEMFCRWYRLALRSVHLGQRAPVTATSVGAPLFRLPAITTQMHKYKILKPLTQCHLRILAHAGVKLDVHGGEGVFANVPVGTGARIVILPSAAITSKEIMVSLLQSGIKVSNFFEKFAQK
jgi:hypothetical protein